MAMSFHSSLILPPPRSPNDPNEASNVPTATSAYSAVRSVKTVFPHPVSRGASADSDTTSISRSRQSTDNIHCSTVFPLELIVWSYLGSSQRDSLSRILIALFSTTRISDTRTLTSLVIRYQPSVFVLHTHIYSVLQFSSTTPSPHGHSVIRSLTTPRQRHLVNLARTNKEKNNVLYNPRNCSLSPLELLMSHIIDTPTRRRSEIVCRRWIVRVPPVEVK